MNRVCLCIVPSICPFPVIATQLKEFHSLVREAMKWFSKRVKLGEKLYALSRNQNRSHWRTVAQLLGDYWEHVRFVAFTSLV